MKYKNYTELELRDDFIFGKVMSNPEICRHTLEILLDKHIEKIDYLERQKVIDLTIDGKSVRLDLYVQDEKGSMYNAEMQQSDSTEIRRELPKRSRYYQGMIDLNLLEKGAAYTQLEESYVIFICTFDPFGRNKSKYTFRTACREESDLILEDMTTKIFLNTKGDGEGISEELKTFLQYIETKRAADAFTEQIDKAVERVKCNEEWRKEYMKELLIKHDAKLEGKEEGRAEGRAEGRLEGRAEGRLEGMALFAELTRKLLLEERTEDLLRATEDIPYRRQLYKEYGLEGL